MHSSINEDMSLCNDNEQELMAISITRRYIFFWSIPISLIYNCMILFLECRGGLKILVCDNENKNFSST